MQAFTALALMYAATGHAQEATEPSPIEHALVEYLCRTVQRPAMIGTDAYQSCYASQLAQLRAPFGRKLSTLTAADRKAIDGLCGDFQATRGRDAYLACLHEQLVSIRTRRGLGFLFEAPLVTPQAAVQPNPLVASPAPMEQPTSTLWWWIAGIVVLAGGAGGAAFVVVKRRPVPQHHTCRGCGAPLPAAGDLCADCRHDAAEARRRASAVRVEDASEFDPYVVLGVDRRAGAEQILFAYEEAKARYDAIHYEHLGLEVQEHFRTKAAAVEHAYLMLAAREEFSESK